MNDFEKVIIKNRLEKELKLLKKYDKDRCNKMDCEICKEEYEGCDRFKEEIRADLLYKLCKDLSIDISDLDLNVTF